MSSTKPSNRLNRAELAQLRALLEANGERGLAEFLGLHVATIARALAGFELLSSTARVIRVSLAERQEDGPQ